MPMIPFMQRFPELGARETRSLAVVNDPDLPDGEFGFIELYCNEPGCDCRRVVIQVLRPETGWTKIWATISFGWQDKKGPYLDPLNEQSAYAPAILELFRTVLQSPGYVERLEQHYRMFRNRGAIQETSRIENKRKRLRDPRRRGRHH